MESFIFFFLALLRLKHNVTKLSSPSVSQNTSVYFTQEPPRSHLPKLTLSCRLSPLLFILLVLFSRRQGPSLIAASTAPPNPGL